MTRLKTVILIGIICGVTGLKEPRPDEGAEYEDRDMHPLDIIRKYGYPAENHTVTTEDGYILAIHRIPYGRLSPKNESKGVVLLQHGMFCSTNDLIIIGTKRGLAYILADEGYDVWMPNSRGNTYSRKHVKYSPKEKKFWDFSWHEMGVYDLPASIDYILKHTDQKQLIFVGHSQGTTTALVMASERNDYNDKVKLIGLLAPVSYLKHSKSEILKFAAKTERFTGAFLDTMTTGEFLPSNAAIREFGGATCADSQPVTPEICKNALFVGAGFDSKQLNDTMISIIVGHTPAGSSVKAVQHYAQCFNKNTFRQFDYGPVENHNKYNQLDPPEYRLENVKIPISMIWASNDWLSVKEDVDQLTNRINHTLKEKILISYPKWNHLDYLYGKDILTYLAEPLIKILNNC